MITTSSEESLIDVQGSSGSQPEGSNSDLVRLDNENLDDIVIDYLIDSEPTSAILSFCQRKFLLPYVYILSLVGLRPITIDTSDLVAYLGHIQTVFVVVILTTGYFIQYFSYFRRDRGFTNTTYPPIEPPLQFSSPKQVTAYYGETIFVYGVSSILHFCGFLASTYVFRIADNEQLQNLVERVFILHNFPNKLIYMLWSHIACGILWLTLMTSHLIVMETDNIDVMKIIWLGEPTANTQTIAKILLVVTTFAQDLLQVIVLTSYSIQCYLLRRYISILQAKLLQNTIDSLDWMREMSEFRKLLSHLNTKVAMPVCLFTILNLSYTFSSIVYFIKIYNQFTNNKIVIMAVINILLWLILGLYPFFQPH
ncbi:uncharacterized protein LOC116345334 isoform X2 [Contarinia nasturtii]|uniref:uncharacterized protein LOC116345334 isoform X2 n=1 Tax=Contarinia nasturtii TaxID=265458 RepID=UPI0012D4A4D6|nr:uncharacterized protein LOC116345334 isoform X2 [Contarinia nasturtii]